MGFSHDNRSPAKGMQRIQLITQRCAAFAVRQPGENPFIALENLAAASTNRQPRNDLIDQFCLCVLRQGRGNFRIVMDSGSDQRCIALRCLFAQGIEVRQAGDTVGETARLVGYPEPVPDAQAAADDEQGQPRGDVNEDQTAFEYERHTKQRGPG